MRFQRKMVLALGFMTALFSCEKHSSAARQELYKLNGKSIKTSDLGPGAQQNLFDIEYQSYLNKKRIVDDAILQGYIADQVSATKKSEKEVRRELFNVKAVSDENAKAWFDQNKNRLGDRKFEDIKQSIVDYLTDQKENLARESALHRIKSEGKFEFLLAEPAPPQIRIAHEGFPSKGQSNAKVTVVEFADYQCPHCKHAAMSLRKVSEKFKDKINFVFIDFPINPSGISTVVAEGAVCAGEQGKFWEYHYMAFEQQGKLSRESPSKIAEDLTLKIEDFKSCMSSDRPKDKVKSASAEARRLDIKGTPTIYINGHRHLGYSEESLIKTIESHL